MGRAVAKARWRCPVYSKDSRKGGLYETRRPTVDVEDVVLRVREQFLTLWIVCRAREVMEVQSEETSREEQE